MNPPTPDLAHAAAFAFLTAAIVAAQLGDPTLATEMVAAAGMLEITAAKLDRPAGVKRASTDATRLDITDGIPGTAVRSYITIGPAVAVNLV